MPSRIPSVLAVVALSALLCAHLDAAEAAPPRTLSLGGTWSSRLDPEGKGLDERWYSASLPERIRLPGSTDEAGLGTPNTGDDGFSHLSRLVTYAGAAWYAREVEIPASWEGKRVTLFLERCHWETRAWLDDRELGPEDSLSVPHVHDLGTDVPTGRHRLTLRVDNSYRRDVGGWAHSVTDETQTNWNGVIGRMELRATDPVWIEDVRVHPDAEKRGVKLSVRIENATGAPVTAKLRARVSAPGRPETGEQEIAVAVDPRGAVAEGELLLGPDAELWDEFSPTLHRLSVELRGSAAGEDVSDRREVTFGLRSVGITEDKRIAINRRPIYLRGTLECCIFPLTGYPPMDEAAWERILGIARSHGLNHLRFHSWCPPEAAFAAADRMGFYFQVEGPFWTGNWGKDLERDQWAERELRRIESAYGNHPSFTMLSIGNEPGGDLSVIHGITKRLKESDPRHLHMSGTGWGQGPYDDYTVTPVRGARGPSTDWNFAERIVERRVPAVSHEIGQWCVYPNLAEIPKYTGVVRARNYERIRDDLAERGMLDLAHAFTLSSGKLSALLYKEEIEVLLRTPGHSGFQLLDLHDFPGQGTSPIGILDAFWESKGIIDPEEFRRFCGPTVPLARLPKRTFTTVETFEAKVEITHFGREDLRDATPAWSLTTANGAEVARGELPTVTIHRGGLTRLGTIEVRLGGVEAPARCRLTVSIPGSEARNDWDIWIYPATVPLEPPEGVVVAKEWDASLKSTLAEGRTVLLLPPARRLRCSTPARFQTVFWNPNMFRQVDSMGILCDPSHPAFALYPTEGHADWQWYDLLERSRALILDETPKSFRPLVQVIDSFARNRKLGLLLETKVGPGKLLVSTLDLERDLETRLGARQLRASILAYARSDAFKPEQELPIELLDGLLDTTPWCLAQRFPEAKVTADAEASGYEAEKAIDGDLDTIWHTPWEPSPAPMPHHLVVDLGREAHIAGIVYLPRQDMANGRIADFAVFAGTDPETLGEPITTGRWPDDIERQEVKFPAPVAARYLKLEARSEVRRNAFAAVAELDVILEK